MALRRLTAKATAALYKRVLVENEWRLSMCCVVSQSGPNLEPLACGYERDHRGPHSWGSLPTLVAEEGKPS